MVIDTSAILAIYFNEPHGPWALQQLADAASSADRQVMSTVNLTECLIRIYDREPVRASEFEQMLLTSGIEFIAPDTAQSILAARARLTFPLNLGDCFAYALAKVESQPILTLDADFCSVDVPVILPPETKR